MFWWDSRAMNGHSGSGGKHAGGHPPPRNMAALKRKRRKQIKAARKQGRTGR